MVNARRSTARSGCARAGRRQVRIARVGLNSRLDTLQAALLLPKLAILNDEIAARERLAAHYDAPPAGAVALPAGGQGGKALRAQHTIQVEQRDRVAAVPQAQEYPNGGLLSAADALAVRLYCLWRRRPRSLPVSERV